MLHETLFVALFMSVEYDKLGTETENANYTNRKDAAISMKDTAASQ